MTQNNLYMEGDEMRLYIDVQPLFIDTLENSKNAAAASAAAAAQSEANARGWKNQIADYKTSLELFYANASNGLTTLYNDSVTDFNAVKSTAESSLESQKSTILSNIDSAKQSAISNINTYINQARNYAEQAQNTVDNRVSLEHLNQSKALETGDVSDDSDVLLQVSQMAHSNFDVSKFTVNGTTGLTDDGIIPQGLSGNNTVKPNYLLPLWNNNSWEIITPLYTLTPSDTNEHQIFRYLQSFYYEPVGANRDDGVNLLYQNSTSSISIKFYAFYGTSISNADTITGSIQNPINNPLQFKMKNTGTQYELYYRENGIGTWTSLGSQAKNHDFTNVHTSLPTISYFGDAAYTMQGSTDLKYLSIISNSVEGFNACKTGTDSVTIGGNSVSIPYVLSNTGSKIVDSAYRTQINALYAQEGYALYFTLSDTDFTLPKGEIYGMIEKLRELIMERTAQEG